MYKTDGKKRVYPENVYCAIFVCAAYPNMPSDAEETLEYIAKFLNPKEADMFMLNYKDEMSYSEIGEKYSLTKERVRQIITKTEYKLRQSDRSKILSVGREKYLKSVVAANEEAKKLYCERISELEALIQKQGEEITEYADKIAELEQDTLSVGIDCLDLSVRSWNCLSLAGIHTVKDIIEFGDLSGIRNMGKISVQEVQDKTAALLTRQGANTTKCSTL